MHRNKVLTKEDMTRAIVMFNGRHRRFKIEYDSQINYLCVKDKKSKNYKVFITLSNLNDFDDLVEVLNDLITDLS